MQISISSVLISLASCTVLVLLIQVLLQTRRAYKTFRVGLLYVIVTVASLRLFIPVEFIHTKTLASRHVLPALFEFGRKKAGVFPNLEINYFLLIGILWLCGFLISLLLLAIKIHRSRLLTQTLIYASIPMRYEQYSPKVPIYKIRAQTPPFVYGVFHPAIFIPDVILDSDQLHDIIMHEMQHIKNRDVFLKILIQILVCLYWWFPPLYVLRIQVNIITELRVDSQVTQALSEPDYYRYISNLIQVTKVLRKSAESKTYFSASEVPMFADGGHHTLKRRIEFLLEEHNIRPTSWIALGLAIIIPYVMTSIVIEPDYVRDNQIANKTKELDSGW